MMGGGVGSWSSIGDVSKLEQQAKEVLQSGKRNVFISFPNEDIDDVNLLRAQAKNENSDIEFNDHSVREPFNSERADYIKQKISERIKRSSVTVVYLSENTVQSQWVKWEVKRSHELGKCVIATHSEANSGVSIPNWITSKNIKVVPWSHLADAISKL